ncbi:MAG: DNA gyrase subunit A [Candidatus Micrarchaeia archaeon]
MAESIIQRPLETELRTSYMDYAMSVIVGRALPDVRDGLKPVHRRILFAMHELGNTHDKPYKKSARVVGEVLGKYHPHGDSAIYDSLVRMAQSFSLSAPLVDGQGNFGSIDGDRAAAMRYTEVRLARIASEMLADLDKKTVAFSPNFDATLEEPTVLPSRLPNLLINGSSGIAVGMATNIPPHNLSEICDAVCAVIENKELDAMGLLGIVQGPDFPTGALILGKAGIADAYKTGRGSVRIRARTEIIDDRKDKTRKKIIVSEIPYQVNKAELIRKIAQLVKDKTIDGITDINDHSDRDGLHIEIALRRDANPEVVLNQLYSHSQLETTFGVINLALVDGKPQVMPLREMLDQFILHRRSIIRKRCEFDLDQSSERAHVLEGLKIAIADIDNVIRTIKAASNAQEARGQLMAKFGLSEKQSAAILEMKLSRLTALETSKIENEYSQLQSFIESLKKILADENEIFKIIADEMRELKAKYGFERRTEIIDYEGDIEDEDLIPNDPVAIIITKSDYVKRVNLSEYRAQKRGGKGIIGTETKEDDQIKDLLVANNHDYLLFFTEKGNVHWLKAYKIPLIGRYAMGKPIVNLIDIDGEGISAAIKVSAFTKDEFLVMATRNGIVKRSSLDEYSRPRRGGIRAITLRENDSLISVKKTDGKRQIILGSKKGMGIKFDENDIREIGRTGMGVIGMRLDGGDYVIDMALDVYPALLSVTENGYGKRTSLDEYRGQNRGGKGVINIKTEGRNGNVVSIMTVSDRHEVMLLSSGGKAIRLPVAGVSVIGRNTQGVRLMKLEPGEKIISVERIEAENGNGAEPAHGNTEGSDSLPAQGAVPEEGQGGETGSPAESSES